MHVVSLYAGTHVHPGSAQMQRQPSYHSTVGCVCTRFELHDTMISSFLNPY
eukprot:m.280256 g.280256  ORF g.280256 m.280256 type:complete len:51 (-) comp19397_c0_seq4:703-855(-)